MKRNVGLLVLLCLLVQGIWAQTSVTIVSTAGELTGAIANGANIQLTDDIQLENYLNINGISVTIDLNGYTLSRNLSSCSDNGHIFWVHANGNNSGNLTIGGGTIEGGYAPNGGGINVWPGCSLNVNGVTFQNNRARDCGGAIFVREDATVTINNATFTGNSAGNHGGAIWNNGTLNMKGAVTVTGNHRTGGVASNIYLKSGRLITVAGSLTGSTIGVDLEDSSGTFTSGYNTYHSGVAPNTLFTADLSIALNLGLDGNHEANLTANGTIYYVERSWDDTNKQVVSTLKSLTGSVVGYEDVPAEGQYKEVTTANGSWFRMGGYSSGSEYYVVRGDVALETIVVLGSDVHLILCDNAELTLTGGLKLEDDHRLNIHCQSYDDTKMGRLIVTNSYSNAAGIGSAQHEGQEKRVGLLAIYGGHIEATGGTYGAGIGSCARIEGNTTNLCNRVAIYGGYVKATGGDHGAGIGGGSGYNDDGINGGEFHLHHGTVIAQGGAYAAGVGGGGSYYYTLFHSRGKGGWGGRVIINGGSLTATGGENGAGIGSGNIYGADEEIKNTGGKITINGGTVTATGGDNGAGIGGGYCCGGPELTITGGTVTANGGENGAGIGGGDSGCGGVIKISGGTVTALGGEGGAGIGGGNGRGGTRVGRGGNVTITGGRVIAMAGEQGGEGNRAIGPGQEARTGYWENPENIYGTLTISNKMMVGAGNNGSVERIVNYDERMNACWYRSYAEISPCPHEGTFFTSSSGNTPNDTHATHCQHCTTYYPGEKHTFVDGQCTVCGQETSFDWTHLRLLPAPGSYTVTAGYDNNFGATSEGYKYLFDAIYTEENYDKGFSYPKWCVMKFNSGAATFGNKPCYVEFNTAEPVIPKIYALVTGNDSYQYIGRNPQTWNLKAKLNKNDGWTTIASITEDRVLQDVDCIAYAFGINNNANNAYKYFRFEIFANRGADTMQLTELQLWVEDGVALVDNIDNTGVIGNHNGQTTDVTLAGRTLYKDGDWNTLCLPFSLTSLTGTPLADATIKTLESSEFNEGTGTLTLNFSENDLTAIDAGKPYLVKWAGTDEYIQNPEFHNVTISTDIAPVTTDAVNFIGTTSPFNFTANNHSVLFLGGGSTLYYPSTALTIGSCRAYFQLKGIAAGTPAGVRVFKLNFGDETGILSTTNYTNYTKVQLDGPEGKVNYTNSVYDLQGRKVSTPTVNLKKGVYIYNGKKVVIKK